MKCAKCPLYHYWSNESDRGEECAIFGDGWDSPFQYEDKEGTIVGCYLEWHFIKKADAERDEYYASMAQSFIDEGVQNLQNLIHAYEKCCETSGYVGLTETAERREE